MNSMKSVIPCGLEALLEAQFTFNNRKRIVVLL